MSAHRSLTRQCWRPLLLALCLILPSTVAAHTAALLLEYHMTMFGPQNGAPNDVVQFAQTRDGRLWLASPNGLYRFDGLRFERIDRMHGKSLHSPNVMGLLATPEGGLWIGHRYGGVTQIQDGRLLLHKPGEGLPASQVLSIARGPDGAIWAATGQGLAYLAPGAGRFVTVDAAAGLPHTTIHKVLFTGDGRQWVATDQGMYYRDPGSRHYRRAWPYVPLRSMDQAPDGTLWASDGVDRHYRVRVDAPPGVRSAVSIPGGHGLHFDRDGSMWVLKERALERRGFPYANGSGPAQANAQFEGLVPQMWFQDRERNIWIGTPEGVARLRPNRVHNLQSDVEFRNPSVTADADGRILVGDRTNGLYSADATGRLRKIAPISPNSSYRAPDGTLWLGAVGARWRREPDGRWTRFPHPPELAGYATQAMLQASDGGMWVALQTLGLFRVDGGQWRRHGALAALPTGLALSLAGDGDGHTWVGYSGGRIARISGTHVQVYGEADGLALGNVQSLLIDGARVWAGGERGVAWFERGRWRSLAAPLRGISGMARTRDGDLWLHGSEGITRIAQAHVERALRQPAEAVVYERFDALDGLRGSAEQIRPFPSLVQGSDGRLWFPTATHVAFIDPRRIVRNPLAPPVHIVAVRAGGRAYEGARIELPTGTRDLAIAYTAASLSIPERVRFRYRLHGVDGAWQDAGTRREAFYTNLEPGSYRFHVSAANEDGVWNDAGAQLTVVIPPRFFQTGWFTALLALAALLLLYGVYRLRVRQLTRRTDDLLHARLAERARIARGLHDTLLQSVQGLIMFFQQQARRLPNDAEERVKIEQTLKLADQLMSEGRDYILDLRAAAEPCELGEALRAYGAVLLQERLLVTVTGRPRPLAPGVREELHAIAREALFNCACHAGASRVELMLDYGQERLQLMVRDDGCGMAQERPGHYGLCGMRERAAAIGAEFSLESQPGRGTSVTLALAAGAAYAGHSRAHPLARLRRRLPFVDAA